MTSQFENLQRWRCGNCGTWNDSINTECRKCSSPIQRYDAIQMWNKLSPVENRFYKEVMPSMAQELNKTNKLLTALISQVEALSKEVKK